MKKHLTAGQWVCLGLTALFLVLAVVTYLTDTLTDTVNVPLIEKHKTGAGMLTEDTPVTQTFKATQNGMNAVEVMVSTYSKKPKEGVMTLWLTDEAGTELARVELPVSELKNNGFVALPLTQAQSASAGKTYTFFATSNCTDQKGVTLRIGPATSPELALSLTLADGTQDAEDALNLRACYTVTTYGWMAGMTCLLLALCFAAAVPLTGRKERAHA